MKWNCFSNIYCVKDLSHYFIGKEFSHSKYCHYTSLQIIEEILKKKRLFLSCVRGFNDACDKEQFGEKREQKNYYSVCFSTGESENLALWYLYSGINGKGGRIRFTLNKIKKIIEESTFELVKLGKKTSEPYGKRLLLENGKNMRLRFQDVLYWQEQKNNVRLKYNTMTNNNVSVDDFNIYKEQNKGFLKDTIWYHEKESRLLIELQGNAKDFIDDNYDYVVVMNFPEKFNCNWINIEFAPEICRNELTKIMENFSTLKRYCEENKCEHLSIHSGKIKMNLCRKCVVKKCKEKLQNGKK